MAISRREFIVGSGASLSALALLRALPANAADPLQKGLLPSADEMWSEVKFVNNTMGPTRLTGSSQHSAFVQYLKDHLYYAEASCTVGRANFITPENCVAETERLIAAALNHRRPVYMAFPGDVAGQPVVGTMQPFAGPQSAWPGQRC